MKFRMVDQVLDWDAGRGIRGIKTLSFEEYCLRSTLCMTGELPQSLLLESLFQLGNWLVMLSSDYAKLALVSEIDQVEFASALEPGQRMHLEVTVQGWDEAGVTLAGVGKVARRQVVRAQGWRADFASLPQYLDPDDLRVLFSEIHRPDTGGPA